MVSSVCREYSVAPSAALHELGYDRRDVSDWLLADIAQYRGYHDLHSQFESAKAGPGDQFRRRKDELEKHPAWQLYRRTCLTRDAREALKRWTSTSSPPS